MAYTEQRIAEVLSLLEANGGNLSATARETGVPKGTISNWRNKSSNRARSDAAFNNLNVKKEELKAIFLKAAVLSMAEYLRRLQEEPHKISTSDILRAAGISADKFQNLANSEYVELFERLELRVIEAERLAVTTGGHA